MSEVFSILLHNRQRYEQGKEGLWFSLPTTTEKLQEAQAVDAFGKDVLSPESLEIDQASVLKSAQ